MSKFSSTKLTWIGARRRTSGVWVSIETNRV
ncbi:Uncharacterised protein [Mycobacteroides abscessus subsp. abscessus]|nr:Uncharacterised protein [Mycobacteroides abscessus subsp. abscessus]